MNTKPLRYALLAGLVALASPAWAADFSVTVPVQAEGLPAGVNKLAVSCQILTDRNSVVVGAQVVYLPVKGGAFRGDVPVAINASGGVSPALATRYRCVAWFIAESSSGRVYYYSDNPEDGRMFQRFPLVEGAPFKLDTGMLPLPR